MSEDLDAFCDYDIVISNPPYITPLEYQSLYVDVKDWESRVALVTKDALGLEFYQRIVTAKHLYKPGAKLVFEIGESQGSLVKSLMEEHGFISTIHKDLAGRDRSVEGILNI
jgi:release factor glutamine methyltransferase